MRQVFLEYLPYYLSLGMTSEEFWHGDLELCKVYREAQRYRDLRVNFNDWRLGSYIYEALICASGAYREMTQGEIMPYRKEPYPIDERDTEAMEYRNNELKVQQGLSYLESFAELHNKKMANDA